MPLSRTRLLLRGLASTCAAGALLTSCADSQATADKEASGGADDLLVRDIDHRLATSSATSSEERTRQVLTWLDPADPQIVPPSRYWWSVTPSGEGRLSAVVYYRSEEGTLSPAAWGRACRELTVGDSVSARAVACPDDVPASPESSVIGPT